MQIFLQCLTDGAINNFFHRGLCLHTSGKRAQVNSGINSDHNLSSRWFDQSSVHIALPVSGHLGIKMVDRCEGVK